jgi:NADH-quinone oxidoreductase subunit N
MAPFHMWAPDVYEGAPTPVTAFLATGSKAAAVAATAVLFLGPLDVVRSDMTGIFLLAAVLSLAVGTLGAMRQANLRRFVAYSSIAQAGYMLMAFTGGAGSESAARTALQYNLIVYGTASFGLFLVIGAIGRDGPETLPSLRGLSARSPALAALLALSLFSLVGLPPLAGFLGKFLLFSVAARSGHYALIFVAAVAVALSFFYYMRLVREAYLPVPADDESARLPLELGLAERCAALSLAILLVLLGTWPGLLAYITARS